MSKSGTRSRGFTVLEVLIPIIIVGIISVLVLPSFSEMIKEQRLRQISAEFRSSVVLARSEAVKRNDYLGLVPNGTWSDGWCVNSTTLEPFCTEYSIFKYGTKNNTVITSNATSVVFNDWGRTTSCPQFSVTIDNCSMCLAITPDGRVMSHKGQCGNACMTVDDSKAWSETCQ